MSHRSEAAETRSQPFSSSREAFAYLAGLAVELKRDVYATAARLIAQEGLTGLSPGDLVHDTLIALSDAAGDPNRAEIRPLGPGIIFKHLQFRALQLSREHRRQPLGLEPVEPGWEEDGDSKRPPDPVTRAVLRDELARDTNLDLELARDEAATRLEEITERLRGVLPSLVDESEVSILARRRVGSSEPLSERDRQRATRARNRVWPAVLDELQRTCGDMVTDGDRVRRLAVLADEGLFGQRRSEEAPPDITPIA